MESSDSAQRIDRLLKRDDVRQRFEFAWRAGANPSLGQFLEEVASADRGKLFVDLLGVELELRRERGEAPTATEYRQHHPEYAAHIDAVFREAADQTRISPADLRPGSVLGDFRITREIGRGGMGVVYEAEQMSLGRQVAVKVLTPDRHALDNPRARFVREARAAAGLHHTNIVPVLEVGEHDGILYYAMQLIQGRPLDRVLADLRQQLGSETSGGAGVERERSDSRSTDHQQADCDTAGHPSVEPSSHDVPARPAGAEHPAAALRTASPVGATLLPDRGRESWRHVSRIGRQVAEALQYAHERGILHRDVKPANLLVDAQDHVWVTDFGLAKVEDSDLTHRNDVVGTLRYLAPEALDGQTDGRSDVYSLGLTLYELLSFRSPYPARERSDLLRQIRGAEIVPLSKIAPGVPHDLATIVSKAIQRDPRDRYQTAQQLADDLDRFGHDQPILARRHSAAELLVRWIRRNPTVAGLVGALALLLLVMAVSSTVAAFYFYRQETQQKQLAVQLDQQRQAAEAAEAATRNAQQQVVRSLANLHADQGLRSLEQGDHLRALLSTASALEQLADLPSAAAIPGELSREQSLRYRLAALLAHLPPIVARHEFREFDWQQATLNGFSGSTTTNPPQLQFVDNGELCLVSLLKDVAFRWNPDTDTVHRVSLSQPLTAGPEAAPVSDVRYTCDVRFAVRFTASDGLELWSCAPQARVCQLGPLPHDVTGLPGSWASPDGKRLFVCFALGATSLEMRLWDTVTGHLLLTQPIRLAPPQAIYRPDVQFSQDSRRATLKIVEATVVDMETGTVLVPPALRISPIAVLDPRGRFLFASHGSCIQARDVEAPADAPPAAEILLPTGTTVTCMAGDDGGRWTVAGTVAGDLYVVDMAQLSLVHTPVRHNDAIIERLEINPQGDAVAVADAEGMIRVWSLPAGCPLTPPLRCDRQVSSLAWRDDGRRLAAATVSGDVTQWELTRLPDTPDPNVSNPYMLPAPDGSQLLSWGGQADPVVWDLASHPPRVTASLRLRRMLAASWCPDGTRIAIVSQPESAAGLEFRMWDHAHARADLLQWHDSYRWHASDMFIGFTDDGHRLAVRAESGPAVIDLDRGTEVFRFSLNPTGHFALFCCAVSNRLIAACERMTATDKENCLRVWGPTGQLVLQSPLPVGRRVYWLRFSPDGSLLAVVGEFGVRLWRCRDQQLVPIDTPGVDDSVDQVCFDPTGNRLAFVDGNSFCRVAHVQDQLIFRRPFYLPGNPRHLSFSPDGRRLAVVTARRGVAVWDGSRGEPLTPDYFQESNLLQPVFSPDGATLVVAQRRGALKWLSVPLATETPWPELTWQLQRATGYAWSEEKGVRRLTAAEWKRLSQSASPDPLSTAR